MPRLLSILSLVALTVIAYAPSFTSGFVYDDNLLLVHNRPLKRWSAGAEGAVSTGEMLASDFGQFAARGEKESDLRPIDYYRPVITALYLLDTVLWGDAEASGGTVRWRSLNPFGFHLLNVLFHALNAVLVFSIVRSLTRASYARTAAWFAGALFAVHPIHTESVSWIAGRTDVVATTFVLAATWSWIRFRARTSRGERAWLAKWSAMGFAVVGIFTKEVAVAVIPVLAAFELLAARHGGASVRERLVALAPMLAIVPLYFLVKASLVEAAGGEDDWVGVSWLTSFWSFWSASAWYARKIVWPIPLDLYPMIDFVGAGVGAVLLLAHVVVGGGLGWLAWRMCGAAKSTLPLLGLIGYVVALAPMSCLVPGLRLLRYGEDIDFPTAERFLYLPSVFALIAVGWLIGWLIRRSPIAWGAVVLVFVGLIATFQRGADWRADLPLYEAAVATTPRSVRMQTNYGLELIRAYRVEETKRTSFEALRLQEEVYKRSPEPIGYENLAVAYGLEQDYAAALRFMDTAFHRVPKLDIGLRYAFALLAVAGVRGDASMLDRARGVCDKLATNFPTSETLRQERGFIDEIAGVWRAPSKDDEATAALGRSFFQVGMKLAMSGEARYVDAIATFERGFDLLPQGELRDRPKTRAMREAMSRQYLEVVEAARLRYRQRLEAAPTATLHFLLGEVERRAGFRTADRAALERATTHYENALALEPTHLGAAMARSAFAVRSGQDAPAAAEVEEVAIAHTWLDRPLAAEEALRTLTAAYRVYHRRKPWGERMRRAIDKVVEIEASRVTLRPGDRAQAKAWTNVGSLHVIAADGLDEPARLKDAEAALRKALTFDRKLPNAAASLIAVLRRLGKRGEADELKRKTHELLPDHPFFK